MRNIVQTISRIDQAVFDHPVTVRVCHVLSGLLGIVLSVLTLGLIVGWSTIPASSVLVLIILNAFYLFALRSTIARIFRTPRADA